MSIWIRFSLENSFEHYETHTVWTYLIYNVNCVVFTGPKSKPATPIGGQTNNPQVLQAVYTDTNGQPVYIMSQQPTLIPLQLQQPSVQLGQISQTSTSQVYYIQRDIPFKVNGLTHSVVI